MTILIPEHISKELADKIREFSGETRISILRIQENESLLRRATRRLLGAYLPYSLYSRIGAYLKPKKKYKFFVDNTELTEPIENIDVFLATWVINKDIFCRLLNFLPALKWVHSTKTGVDHLYDERIVRGNILLTSSKGIHSRRIAEFVIAIILAFSKNLLEHMKLNQRRIWQELSAVEITGKTVGILGVGNIGKEIAKMARTLGMKVSGFALTAASSASVDRLYKKDELHKLLADSDFIVNCLPLTAMTKMILGEKEFACMKSSSFLINISRGEVIDEKALIIALREKKIAGAALDVINGDSIPHKHPFYDLTNVLLTHHSAYNSINANEEIIEGFIDNIRRFLSKSSLNGVINKDRWF